MCFTTETNCSVQNYFVFAGAQWMHLILSYLQKDDFWLWNSLLHSMEPQNSDELKFWILSWLVGNLQLNDDSDEDEEKASQRLIQQVWYPHRTNLKHSLFTPFNFQKTAKSHRIENRNTPWSSYQLFPLQNASLESLETFHLFESMEKHWFHIFEALCLVPNILLPCLKCTAHLQMLFMCILNLESSLLSWTFFFSFFFFWGGGGLVLWEFFFFCH